MINKTYNLLCYWGSHYIVTDEDHVVHWQKILEYGKPVGSWHKHLFKSILVSDGNKVKFVRTLTQKDLDEIFLDLI